MKTHMIVMAALVGLSGSSLLAGTTISGKYVEARTAEVFTGGCIMSSEADTVGKQAVLAWKVDRRQLQRRLARRTIRRRCPVRRCQPRHPRNRRRSCQGQVGGRRRRAGQRRAAHRSCRHGSPSFAKASVGTVVNVSSAPIQFSETEHGVNVTTSQAKLDISKHLDHDPTCGSMQWFAPLAQVTEAEMSQTEEHSFTGSSLGTKWSAPNRRSSYIGSFAY